MILGISAVGFDLGETLMQYAGIPLNWQGSYTEALTAVWEACGCGRTSSANGSDRTTMRSPSEAELSRAATVLARYNTRLNPRTVEVPAAARIFSEVLACWDWGRPSAGSEQEPSGKTISLAEEAFFGLFQQC